MLRTDKPIYKVILILNLLFIVAGIVLSVIGIAGPAANAFKIISRIVAIACLVFAGFYILGGYTKNAAKYYKVYGVLLAIKYFAGILSGSTKSRTPFGTAVITLSLVIVLVLLLSENLGKTKSLVLCGLLVILRAVILLPPIIKGIISINFIITNLVNIDLACLYGIMTYAKYLDKAERGTK